MDCNTFKINTTENVYVPSDDSYLLLNMLSKHLKENKKKELTILDMGTGTGLLGLCAASSGKVKLAVLADINPHALTLTKENLENNKLHIKAKVVSILKSNLFSNLSDQHFDIISFNPPYLPDEENTELMRDAFYGGWSGIETTERFLNEAKLHLNKDGTVFIIASSLSDLDSLYEYISSCGFSIRKKEIIHIFFEDIIGLELGLTIK